jgi:hypothetical protein
MDTNIRYPAAISYLKMLVIEGIRNCTSFQFVKCQINIRYFVMINQVSHLNWDHTICTRKILCCHSLPFPTYQLLREKIQIDNSKPMLQTKKKKKKRSKIPMHDLEFVPRHIPTNFQYLFIRK